MKRVLVTINSFNLLRKSLAYFVVLLVFFNAGSYKAANRYWISLSAANWTNTANWSTTSGGAGGASVPGAADIAIFDASGTGDCNLNGLVNVSGIQINGYTATINQNANAITIGSSGYSQNSGLFSGGSGTIDQNGGIFALSGGTFQSTSGTFSIGGTLSSSQVIFNHSAGIFIHNNGNVVFDPFSNCFYGTYTIDVIASTLFYDVNINSGASCGAISNIITATGDILGVSNNLTHNNGFISGSLTFSNNLNIGAGTDGGTGTITASGSGAQTYSVDASTPRTCVLEINKPSGALSPATGTTNLSLQGFVQTLGDFTAPTGSFSIGGTFSASRVIFKHSSGTFSHNNGTIIFDPYNNCFWGTYTIDVIPATTFYNISINGAGSCGTYANIASGAGDVVSAAANFTHNDGYISGAFAFAADLIINANSDSGTGTITANGSGAQTYSLATGAPRTCVLGVNKSGGALNPAAGTNDLFVQGFNQVAGDFSAPSGSFSIGGTWGSNTIIFNHSAGTFSNNNCVTIFESFSNCYYGVFGINVLPATSFYDVVFNGGASCGAYSTFTIAVNDTLEATHTLTLSNGAVNSNFIACRGDVNFQSGYDGGTASLVFTGTGNSNLDATGATGVYNGPVIIAKHNSSKTVNLQSPLTLNGSPQSLIFSKGRLISTSVNLIEVGDNVTTSGANDSSYVSGPLMKTGNDAFAFPVGGTSASGSYNYAPILISAPSTNTAQFTAEYFLTNPDPSYSISLMGSGLNHVSSTEYWILDRTTSTANVSVSLTWANRSGGVTALADLRVARWDGAQWVNHGNGGTAGSTSAGTIISSGVFTSFSPITLASVNGNNPLPVELVNFSAKCQDNHLVFNWQTASEKNSRYFEIEESENGILWLVVDTIVAAGFSKVTTNYSYTLQTNLGTIKPNYYRLKQIDYDLSSSIFEAISADDCLTDELVFHFYPNPAADASYLESKKEAINLTSLKLLNSIGQEIYADFENISAKKIQLNTKHLRPGMYYLFLEDNSGITRSVKFVK